MDSRSQIEELSIENLIRNLSWCILNNNISVFLWWYFTVSSCIKESSPYYLTCKSVLYIMKILTEVISWDIIKEYFDKTIISVVKKYSLVPTRAIIIYLSLSLVINKNLLFYNISRCSEECYFHLMPSKSREFR